MAEADYRLMTEATGQRIAAALEALHLATVTGVKGAAEANYRHGDVNLTPANIGAVAKNGDDTKNGNFALINANSADTATLGLANQDGTRALINVLSDGRINFQTFRIAGDADAGREGYFLPTPTQTSGWEGYDIITSKNPAGACAALAPGIPTSSYSLISTYGSGVTKFNPNGDDNNLRCIAFGNGLKRLTGLFKVTTSLSNGAQICVFPSGFSLDNSKNGSIQAFPLMVSTESNVVRTGLMSGGQILLFSSDMPTGTYRIDQLYF